MSSFRERYLESFTDTVSQILADVGKGERKFTETELLILTAYKKELARYERKPAYKSIIETINMVLSPMVGGKEDK
jgi:hypothetical protein